MKQCVCGHTHAEKWEKEFNKNVTDEMVVAKNFIHIKGSFHTNSGGWYSDREVQLYACPKCGTVQTID